FNPFNGQFFGQLTNQRNRPLVIDGLWGLRFGNGAASGPSNFLFFTAGAHDAKDGLLGAVAPPQPGCRPGPGRREGGQHLWPAPRAACACPAPALLQGGGDLAPAQERDAGEQGRPRPGSQTRVRRGPWVRRWSEQEPTEQPVPLVCGETVDQQQHLL